MREETRLLYDLCFKDSPAFTELYFRERYSDERNVTMYEDEQLVSCLQLIPYSMTFCGAEHIAMNYISAACTHPDYRSRGWMNQVLLKALRISYQNNIPLVTLIPAGESLFTYYEKYGFAKAFDYSEVCYPLESLLPDHSITVSFCTSFPSDAWSCFDKEMRLRNNSVQHDRKDIELVLEDLSIFGGMFLIARSDKGEVVGIAFCLPEHERLFVPDMICQSTSIRDSLFAEALRMSGLDTVCYHSIPANESKKHLGMARIVCAELLLRQYAAAHPACRISFRLTDPLIEENNGLFQLEKGILTRSSSGEGEQVTIPQLTQALLGYHPEALSPLFNTFEKQNPYMSLMLN